MRTTLCLTSMLLAGCGTQSASHTESLTNLPLMILAGGNQSCGDLDLNRIPFTMDMYERFHLLVSQVADKVGAEPTFFITCYAENLDMYYFTNGTKAGTLIDLDAYWDIVKQAVKDKKPERTLVVGHSYGGWQAMEMVMAMPGTLPKVDLVTVDPISKAKCHYYSPWECSHFPSDIDASDRATIAKQTDSWTNIWQDKTTWLHSGPVDEADSNPKLDVAHTAINTDPRTWTTIDTMFLSHFGG